MNDSGDLAAWIELSLVPGLGSQKFRSLLSTFGLPTSVLNATRSQLCRVVPEALAAGILERTGGSESKKPPQGAPHPEHGFLPFPHPKPPTQPLKPPDPPLFLFFPG